MNFSTGPFVGSTQTGGGPLQDYQFSAGGSSFQIVGGFATAPGVLGIPLGTTLLSGVMTGMPFVHNFDTGVVRGFISEVSFSFDQATVHPILGSRYGVPPGASVSGGAVIATTELSNAPNPFVLSTSTNTSAEDGSIFVVNGFTVPVPATFWPFAIGIVTLVAWRWRQEYQDRRVEIESASFHPGSPVAVTIGGETM